MQNEETFNPYVAYPDCDKDRIPNAPARLIRPYHATKRKGCYRSTGCYSWELISCPYCGEKHRHGAGDNPDKVNTLLGHRVAHCDAAKPGNVGYNLVRADQEGDQ